MIKNLIFTTLFLINLLVVPGTGAQVTNLNFFALETEQGLSDKRINCIIRDREGFLWIGTSNGLNRFDGFEFQQFFADGKPGDLPANNITCLYLSYTGELWIGTDNKGVCRYIPEKESFEHFSFNTDGVTPGSDIISGILEDKDSVLYISTDDGLFFRENIHSSINPEPLRTQGDPEDLQNTSRLLGNSIQTVCKDEKQGIWIVYPGWKISHYDHKTGQYKHYSLDQFKDPHKQTDIVSILHDRGKLWLGTVGRNLVEYDPVTSESHELLKGESMVTVNQVYCASDGLLWITSGSGLLRYDRETGDYFRFTSEEGNNLSLSTTPVNCFYEDTVTEIIWIGTVNAGINYAFKTKPFNHMYFSETEYYSISERDVSTIMHDRNNDLWVGLVTGRIEYHVDSEKKKYHIGIESVYDNNFPGNIFSLFQDSEGDIYCSSWSGGVQKFDRKNMKFTPLGGSKQAFLEIFTGSDVRDIDEDDRGNLWLAVHGKGIAVYNKKSGTVRWLKFNEADTNTISNDWVYDIEINGDGYAWIASAWGLSRINLENYSVKKYYAGDDSLSLSHSNVQHLATDRHNRLWISTESNLNLYDYDKDCFYRIKFPELVRDQFVMALEQDIEDYYWASTAIGLIKFGIDFTKDNYPAVMQINEFHQNDGLHADIYALGCSSHDDGGQIFFGGRNGVDYFNPVEISPVFLNPGLRITTFEIFGKKVFPGTDKGPAINGSGEVELSYKENMLGIGFVTLNNLNSEENTNYYKLSPVNDDWVSIKNLRHIIFSNLQPGHYDLALKVKDKYGSEYESDSLLKFYIRPPFWKTRAFIAGIILISVLLIIMYVQVYTSNLRKRQHELEKLVDQRTKELKEKNTQLEENAENLKKTNELLQDRQTKIEEQSAELITQSEYLANTNRELEILNSTKDKFFSIIAHDLKNPFNTIMGFTRLLSENYDEYDDAKNKEFIRYINESVQQVYSLLENLLHWSRSQTNILNINPKNVEVIEIINKAYELLKPTLEKKKLKFEQTIDPGLMIFADSDLMNTVIRNLLSNAIKFTPEGGLVSVSIDPGQNGSVTMIIKDSGIGMSEKALSDLFRIDSRSSQKGTSGETGTGLGMILCKEFMEKMDGSIHVESEAGKGTSVFLTIPASK